MKKIIVDQNKCITALKKIIEYQQLKLNENNTKEENIRYNYNNNLWTVVERLKTGLSEILEV